MLNTRRSPEPESSIGKTRVTESSTFRAQLIASSSPRLRKILTRKLQVATLTERIQACTRCPLHETRTQAVPFHGPTHGRGDLIIVGEAPGADEDRSGVPFVGRSGRLLNRVLEKVGSSRDRVVVVNSVSCRPPNNRDPELSELKACRSNFTDQLDMTGLWVGVALGGYALASILGVPRSSVSVREYLDKPVWKDGRVWFGTYHPAYALRSPGAKADIMLSIRAALSVKFGSAFPPFSQGTNQVIRDKESLEKLTELQILGKTRDDLAVHIHKKGWAFGYSEGLGAQILITDGQDAPKKPIPSKLLELPIYTLEELVRVGEAGKGKGGWSREELRRLHMVREEFGGEIVA